MNFEKPAQGGEVSIEKDIEFKGRQLRAMTRFIGRDEDSDKIFKDILKWADGSGMDDSDRKEHYPNWTPENFKELITVAGLTMDDLRSQLEDAEYPE